MALDFYQCPGILLFGASSHGGYLSLSFDSPNSVKHLGFSRHVAECNPSCALRNVELTTLQFELLREA